jgi:hypothetical protein
MKVYVHSVVIEKKRKEKNEVEEEKDPIELVCMQVSME